MGGEGGRERTISVRRGGRDLFKRTWNRSPGPRAGAIPALEIGLLFAIPRAGETTKLIRRARVARTAAVPRIQRARDGLLGRGPGSGMIFKVSKLREQRNFKMK